MKKSKIIKIVMSIGLSSILLMGCGSKNANPKSSNANTETQATQEKEETKVKLDKENAIVLNDENSYKTVFDLFETQEIKAKKEYLNKTFKVTEEVQDIKKKDGYIIISIYCAEKNRFDNVQVYIEDNEENEEKIANLKKSNPPKKGDIITVYGIFEALPKFDGVGAIYMKLTNCELI